MTPSWNSALCSFTPSPTHDKHEKPINYLEFQNQQLLMRFLEQAAASGNILTVGKQKHYR